MERPLYFALFACCVPVRGAARSTLCDLQRRRHYLVPNSLVGALEMASDRPWDDVCAAAHPDDVAVLNEYVAFLEAQDLGFFTEEPERFPPLSLRWQRPEPIANAIIDVDGRSDHDFNALARQLDELRCKTLQLRFFDPIGVDGLRAAISPFDHGRLRAIEVLAPHSPELTEDEFASVLIEFQRVGRAYLHGAPEDAVLPLPESAAQRIVLRRDRVTSATCCGQVHPQYFVTSLEVFTESLEYNTCLNRKVSVDAHGEIKNCPTMARSFGNAAEVPLAAAVAQPGFKDVWGVTKDQVEVCRDCEFRRICTDCRAVLSDPSNPLSKPATCTYDPYTATWTSPEPAHVGSGRESDSLAVHA
jgi:SPASM domain peptide maturase of grasp-with-spasm system